MKEHYSPIMRTGKHGATITIPHWVPLATLYKFERRPDGSLIYVPVVQ